MLRVYIVLILLLGFRSLSAQVKPDHVSRLVAAENYFAAMAKEKGIRAAFLSVLEESSIIFRNGKPVNAWQYFKNQPAGKDHLFWEPVYARVSKSGDWGFTTGPSTYRQSDTSKTTSYGDYLSVWKKNRRGVWKLAFDIGVSHPKPSIQPKLVFVNPETEKFFHQLGDKRTEQREDIIVSSDKLYGTILKADNQIARKEFLTDNSRLLFPGMQPMNGKEEITAFWNKQQVKLTSEPLKGDRAFSGELACTYGTAIIEGKGKTSHYNYFRIWEIQPGFRWNVLAEVYVPASG